MGTLTDSMKRLVEGIELTARERHAALREMRDDTAKFLRSCQRERNARTQTLAKQARTLTEKLRKENQERGLSARNRMNEVSEGRAANAQDLRKRLQHNGDELRQSVKTLTDELERAAEQRKVAISEIRSGVQNNLNRSLLEHKASSREAKKARIARLDEIRRDVEDLRGSARNMLDEIDSEVQEVVRLWRSIGTEGARVVPEVGREEEEVVEEENWEEKLARQAEDVMEVIRGHPDEGIRLVEIGNELGVDWRSLIPATKSLVDEERVEKVENLYFPVSEE